MIYLGSYEKDFKEEYWETVKSRLDAIDENFMTNIIESSKKFLPDDIFTGGADDFKNFILLPSSEIERLKLYIENEKFTEMQLECFYSAAGKKKMTILYKKFFDSYKSVARAQQDGIQMRIRMVNNLKVTVCPYCNRDYINSRGKIASGAQLDHFFSRSNYPIFSVCLYNLIPSCGNCNRVKSDSEKFFISPFDTNSNKNDGFKFSYGFKGFNGVEVIMNSTENFENNFEVLKLQSAYEIHSNEILDLLELNKFYTETQRVEIREVLDRINISNEELKKMIFGKEITLDIMKSKPLGKMMYDLHKELDIY